ncbi:domain of Kin17 curved DNA-binding protein-domain-containing protein [Annulohypoxylon maeteangense]|uniref:domain of Kin17 curved DNA-binding protein-domain-containing protein n=1 Tax=Annulohypoxylon maeteangense TaxID=1927788 RepID=UPI002007F084|nr:domain of Kin17 curved DNA-binding protein-domain-containing protein [Annulohypoxylon maeteangense]KAI0883184.1 domain of Kin17 curved DNA-binding protein-domain-containing protein [Annulohypoxylon maeteangense]
MPKAEVGSTKFVSNKLKSKGLQRLRWYCQICEKQCRDANAFKMHTQSESHTRKMLLVGEDPKKYIEQFSTEFKKDFLQLLRTSHGEKGVLINHFYQNYIANKEHIHMNATKWHSLTDFAKHLGREGICKVEETDKGIQVAWIDDSPEALRRKEAVRRKEMQDKGDEEREQMMIREQIRRARKAAGQPIDDDNENDNDKAEESGGLKRQEGEKIKLSFGAKPTSQPAPAASLDKPTSTPEPSNSPTDETKDSDSTSQQPPQTTTAEKPAAAPISLKMTAKPQAKNVFAAAKKNALAGASKKAVFEQPKKMSEAERIMREEIERKRGRGFGNGNGGREGGSKRQRT